MDAVTISDIEKQIKPISQNGFFAFFQRLYRKWLFVWFSYAERKPKSAKIIYQVAFFLIFSQGVTIFQYLLTLFLPKLFGLELAGIEFLFPKIPMYKIDGVQKYWSILGYEVVYKDGVAVIGGGLGYFLAFEIATFLAQVINFPLQRNITFKSHGNPYYQALWYFIGWVLISLFCNGINSLWLPYGAEKMPFAVYNILTILLMGGISATIFFFIFKLIFPDYNVAFNRAQRRLTKLEKTSAGTKKLEKARINVQELQKKAEIYNLQRKLDIASSKLSAKAMTFIYEKNKNSKEVNTEALFNSAVEALREKTQIEQEFMLKKEQ